MYSLEVVIVLLLLFLAYVFNKPFVSYNEFEDAAKLSGYFYTLDLQDLRFRSSLSPEKYMEKYLSCFERFSLWEKIKLNYAIHKISRILPDKLRRVKWKFAKLKVNYKVEYAYPHTMRDVIILNDNVLYGDKLLSTLIHELVHVYQKLNPLDNDVLLSTMGFYRFDKIYKDIQYDFDNNILPRSVANPDKGGDYYIIKNGHRFLLRTIYSNNYDGRDVKNIGISLENREITQVNFQDDVMYQCQPNEIVAELVCRVITRKGHVRQDFYTKISEWLSRTVVQE